MKLRYHILFIILLTEDIFCFKNDDSLKYTSETPNLKKHSFYDTFLGNCSNNNKDDNNLSTNILQSLFCSFKKLFYKDTEIEKDIEAINHNAKEIKDDIIKNSSNIEKNATKLKEDIYKNSSYWSNLLKKSINEELHEIDKRSNEQLEKLKQNIDNNALFSKIFNIGSSEGIKVEENKNTDTEKNEEKKKSLWFFSLDDKHTEQNKEDSGSLKEKNSFFSIFQNDDKKKNTSSSTAKENKGHWWFYDKNAENEQKQKVTINEVDKTDLDNNEERKSLFDFFSNKDKNIVEKKEEIKDDQEKIQKQVFSLFSKNSNEEKKESNTESDIDQEHRKTLSWNKTSSIEENKNENNTKNNAYWWQKKKVSQNENLIDNETRNNNIKEQDKSIDEKVKKENHSIFNLWKGESKDSNDAVIENKTDTNYNDVVSEGNEEEKKKKEKSLFNKYEIHDDNNLKLYNSDKEYKKMNSSKTKKDDSKKFKIIDLKKYYDVNENSDDINYLPLLNSEHQYEENVDCHPLIVFKVCLNKCYKSLYNENKEVSDKNSLSVNEYKYLEKCILKCKKLSFDYAHGGCVQKSGNVLNKKQNYKDYLEELNVYNLKLEEHPSTFSDFTFQEKYFDNKNSATESIKVDLENNSSDANNEKAFRLLDVSKEKLSTHVFDKDNSEKIKNFMKDKELSASSNITGKSFNFFKAFKNEKENESNDEKLKDEQYNENNNYNLDMNNNDTDKNTQPNDYNYLATCFFLVLLLITFFVYLSAFTNIINQFYVSFKEKVCLFIKGHYKATFDNSYKESSETFLPKNQNNNFRNNYENLYHSFREKPYDIA